ncbi:scaffold protein [Vibrio sp. MACH09]|nr:scaffold protein [Vibrio sp. MACH09]
MNKKILAILPVILSTSALSAPSPWSIGVGAAYSPEVYKGTPSSRVVIPIVGYEGEHFFMRGFSAGYRINPAGSTHNLVMRLVYDPRSFKPSDSSIAAMKKLDKRESTVMGGISYQYLSPIGLFETGVGTDIGNKHNGLYAEAAWRLPYRTPTWGITPSIGYSYNDEKLNAHLYGVSKEESARTGGEIAAFDPSWDGHYFAGLSGYLMLMDNFMVNAGVRYTNIEGDLEDSPILDGTVSITANVGVVYMF